MKTITIWSAAMSVFFSLSLSASVYEAGRDYLVAGAGNPAAVERSLTDLVGRMGATMEALSLPKPVPAGMAVANAAPSDDLKPVVDWVRSEGRQSGVAAVAVRLMGLPAAQTGDIPALQKAYRVDADNGAIYAFTLVPIDGRHELIVGRRSASDFVLWRVDARGNPISTVSVDADVKLVPNDQYREQCRKTIEYFLRKAPRPAVG
jgi:hypothetical protein